MPLPAALSFPAPTRRPRSPLGRKASAPANLLLAICSSGLLVLAGCAAGTSAPPPAVGLTISGPAQVRLGATAQLAASVTNSANSSVTWQVNGVAGGGSSTGTISATGLYTPPAALPTPNTVTITATSAASATATASQTESILNPIPAIGSAIITKSALGATYLLDVIGTGFATGAQIQVSGVSVPTTAVSGTELQASITLAAGLTSVPVDVLNPDPGTTSSTVATAQLQAVKATLAAAARLLDQATFGPTLNDIQHVQQVGLDAWINEQMALTPTTLPDIANPAPTPCMNNTVPCEQSEWWQESLTAPDQLRQRVAFALAEIFVISTNMVNARAVTPYQNLLSNDAFGNFSTVLKDVTLSPGMGAYLNMLNSYKPGNGQIANENYARELMQLFSTGLYDLNQDGTLKKDAQGLPIDVYTQAQVQAFARAYTGWTYALPGGGSPSALTNTANFDMPMAPVDAAHDLTAKTLLNGTVLPAGQSTVQDLNAALANLFAHPNVGPFVCKQLIQHLVTSNPSPGYVRRIAAVFADDGSGTPTSRGNLKAVIKAILLDPEARAGDTNSSFDGGHLREPILYLSAVLRGLGAVNNDQAAGRDTLANASFANLSNYTGTLGERPYGSGSVFNFFPPSYVIPATTLNAPEFGLENTATAILGLSLADNIVYNRIGGFKTDLSAGSALGLTAGTVSNSTNNGNLVDSLGLIFLHGQMPAAMRTALVNHLNTLTDPAQRVRVATYLVITSSLYKINH